MGLTLVSQCICNGHDSVFVTSPVAAYLIRLPSAQSSSNSNIPYHMTFHTAVCFDCIQLTQMARKEDQMLKHVVTVDRNSQAMYAQLEKMHGSVNAAEDDGARMQSQLHTMQQQLVRASIAWLSSCALACLPTCMVRHAVACLCHELLLYWRPTVVRHGIAQPFDLAVVCS